MSGINAAVPFLLEFNRGGLTSLRLRDDRWPTEYIRPGQTLGDVLLQVRSGPAEPWRDMRAFGSGDVRTAIRGPDGSSEVEFAYAGDSRGVHGLKGLDLTSRFTWSDTCLDWSVTVRNRTDGPVEIGDLALPLPFNNDFQGSNLANYTTVVARQGYVAGHGSFQVWLRPNGEGPFLVMTPLPGTKLEFYEQLEADPSRSPVLYRVFVHSLATGGRTPGTWRQPHTSAVLGPCNSETDAATYGFRFRWAGDQEGVRQVLYEEGCFDIRVAPGMTVPEDLEARISIRTRNPDYQLEPEHPAETIIEPLPSPDPERDLYRVRFGRLGENLVTIRHGEDRYYLMEFFVTEPLAVLLDKRCRFLVGKQQHRDPDQWYDGLFSVWDMRRAVLRSPRDTDGFDGWWGYVLCCDDTALPKAPFLAMKERAPPGPGADRGRRVLHRAVPVGPDAAHGQGNALAVRPLRRAQLVREPLQRTRLGLPRPGPGTHLAGLRLPAHRRALLPHVRDCQGPSGLGAARGCPGVSGGGPTARPAPTSKSRPASTSCRRSATPTGPTPWACTTKSRSARSATRWPRRA